MALSATERIGGALMAISPYVVHPVQAAMAAASLNKYFPNRTVLCLGAGAPGDLDAAGIARPRPLVALDESIDIARRTVAKYRESMGIPSSVQRRREKASCL